MKSTHSRTFSRINDMWQIDRHDEFRRHIQMASALQRTKSFHQTSIIYNGRSDIRSSGHFQGINLVKVIVLVNS